MDISVVSDTIAMHPRVDERQRQNEHRQESFSVTGERPDALQNRDPSGPVRRGRGGYRLGLLAFD